MNEDKVLRILQELISGLMVERDKGDFRHVELLEAIAAMGASYVSPTLSAIQEDADNEVYDNDMNRYQEGAQEFAVYKHGTYPFLALAEEAGEVSALAAKQMRKEGHLNKLNREKLADELGDVLWNVAAVASEYHLKLADIADMNLKKLRVRKHAGMISDLSR